MKKTIISFSLLSLLIFSLALALTACSSGNSAAVLPSGPGASEAKTVLEGTWKSVCTQTVNGDYQKNFFTVINGSFTLNAVSYGSSTTCATPLYMVYSAGTIALDATAISLPAGAKSIDTTSTTIILTPSTPAMATSLNNAAYCGVTNWQAELGVSLLGKTCSGKTYPATSYVDYSIYSVSGNILALGDETNAATDGSDPSKRPTTYDVLTLTKQ